MFCLLVVLVRLSVPVQVMMMDDDDDDDDDDVTVHNGEGWSGRGSARGKTNNESDDCGK